MVSAVGRKITKERHARQTPHGKQTVKQLMRHGVSINSLELSGDTSTFDRVARKWNMDYAFYKTGPDKYLLFFKAGQADAMTACFSEYSKKVLSKSKHIPIRDQITRIKPKQHENKTTAKSNDFAVVGGATGQVDFGTKSPEVAERSLYRRKEAVHENR